MSRSHNKSGLRALSISSWSEEELAEAIAVMAGMEREEVERLSATRCVLLTTAADGRVSKGGKKIAYGYQICAAVTFGQDRMKEIEASKSADSLCVSHICGTSQCIAPAHLFLEAKRVNDERTHCHFVMAKLRSSGLAHTAIWCDHEPRCGSL